MLGAGLGIYSNEKKNHKESRKGSEIMASQKEHNHEHEDTKHPKEHEGHESHEDHHEMMIRDFKRRLLVSGILTIPILALSQTIQSWFGFALNFPGDQYVLLSLATVIFVYGGWPFLSGFVDEIREKSPGMMTLIAMAITIAYAYSAAIVLGLEGQGFFWELATLIDIMLLGHWIEMRSVMSASNALDELAALMPDEAHRYDGEDLKDVKVSELESGDRILVKPGEKIPADGTILEGKSRIDESMLTGESVPVERSEGDRLIGGSINGEGSLEVEVAHIGEDTYLSKVIGMVEEAQNSKSKAQNLADRAAFWLTIIALTAGFSTLGVWLFLGRSLTFAITRMATVMVITCPHALGLATPLVVARSTALSAKNGLLIRNRTAFENARKIDTVVFDKTGTLTVGSFGVEVIEVFDGTYTEDDVLRFAYSVEYQSEHPIAVGIVEKAEEKSIEREEISDFEAMKGKGIRAKVGDRSIKVVSPGYLEESGIEQPESEEEQSIGTRVFVLEEDQVIGSILLSDQIRDASKEAVRSLKEMGIGCWMLTGDNEKTAKEVSSALDLDGYFAEVLPDEKEAKIRELQEEGRYVAMTGDGVNDAPALARADIGIAIGSGTDVAAETADIILVNSDPSDVVALIHFGRKTYKKMVQNLIWASGYNIIAIPLAAGVLYSFGIMISPAVGAILMSMSTVIVAFNAKLLKVA